MKNLFTILVLLISFSCSQECQEPTNVWFKLSNDTSSKDYGETIAIDMNKGYASTDGSYIYLLLRLKDSRVSLFEAGKNWYSQKSEKRESHRVISFVFKPWYSIQSI